jgi:HD-GYP domain-containing protein (c-di-GMP phosphodiesterase class II)
MKKTVEKEESFEPAITFLTIQDLRPGHRFTRPVFDDKKNLVILPGSILRQKDIERFTRWGLSRLHTRGKVILDRDSLNFERQSIKLAVKHQRLYRSSNTYDSCIRGFDKFYNDLLKGMKTDTSRIDYIINNLNNAVAESKTELIEILQQQQPDGGNPLVANSVNCAIISMIIGGSLKMPNHRIVQLATGALLHDIGWIMVPQDYLSMTGKLSEGQWELIKSHPYHSHSIILNQFKYPAEVAETALYHHEHWNGSGYPKKINSMKIPLAARIVAVADAYTAMLTKRAYRDEFVSYTSLKTVMGDVNRKFDPEIVKALLSELSLYPVGSYVLLNNNTVGYIVATNPNSTIRPKVKVLMDHQGNEVDDQEVVDLHKVSSLYIRDAINPKSFLKL